MISNSKGCSAGFICSVCSMGDDVNNALELLKFNSVSFEAKPT